MNLLATNRLYSVFLVVVQLLSIKAVVNPPFLVETYPYSDARRIASESVDHPRSGGDYSYHSSRSGTDHSNIQDTQSMGENYHFARYPLIYRNILLQHESPAPFVDSAKSSAHIRKSNAGLKKINEGTIPGQSRHSKDLKVTTKVQFTEPQGFHVSLDVQIEISHYNKNAKSCSCRSIEDRNTKEIQENNENELHQIKESCEKTQDVAVVFFLPRGCYADQQEIEARHLFTVPAEKVLLHTHSASSNPELLAEEANGELVVVEFKNVKSSEICECTKSRKNNLINKSVELHSGINDSEISVSNVNGDEMSEDNMGDEEIRFTKYSSIRNPTNNTVENISDETEIPTPNNYRAKQIISSLNFSFPIHLRYHTPHDNYFSPNKLKIIENSEFKVVTIPYPTTYIGKENCNTNRRKINFDKNPTVKRIYDISYLGQNGNAQSTIMTENQYKKVDEFVNDYDTKSAKPFSFINENGGNIFDDDFKNGMKIDLKVPVGSYLNNYVLVATVFCYFVTSSAVVVSLLF